MDLFQKNKLASLTEEQFRNFAFGTHPQAYDEGGLALVVMVAPELLPAIVAIPSVEFVPFHGNALSTWLQVVETLGRLATTVPGYVMAASAGPAHNGALQKAMATSGMNAILATQRQNAWYEAQFAKLQAAFQSGRINRIAWLDEVTNRLKVMAFPDAYWRDVARRLVAEADNRKSEIADSYVEMLQVHPEMRATIDQVDPNWAETPCKREPVRVSVNLAVRSTDLRGCLLAGISLSSSWRRSVFKLRLSGPTTESDIDHRIFVELNL